MFEDYDLIVSSFMTQYGIRLMTKEFETLSWDEFKALLSGLDEKTPLGKVVCIRAEENKDVLKHFTKEQHAIRNKWRSKRAKEMNIEDYNFALEEIKRAFLCMAGEK